MNFPITGGIASGTVEVNIDLAQENVYWKISKEPASPGYDEVNSTLTINGVTGLTEYTGNTTGVTDFEIVIPAYTGTTTAWTRYAVECYRGDTKINLGNTPITIGRRQVAANTVIVDAQNLEKRYIPASGGSNDCSVDVRVNISQIGYHLVIEPLVSKQSATTLTVNGVDYGFGSFTADTIGVYNFSISYPAWDGSGDTTRRGKRYTDYYIYVKNSQGNIVILGDTPIEIIYYQNPPTNKNIFLGENAVNAMYIGSESATCAYLGDELVWEASSPAPPTPVYSAMPLTLEILSAGTIEWKAAHTAYTVTIEYSLNGGNWTSITSNTGGAKIADAVAGDIIQIRGNNNIANSVLRYNSIAGTAYFNAYGNAMSMINSTGFTGSTTIGFYGLCGLFRNSKIVSAEHLILPATSLTTSCYQYLFYGCNELTTAPELPATTLAFGSYRQMFYGCSNLNYIKCLATDISESNCTLNWVNGVAATGTFVKNSSMTGWTTGADGIPNGWTVVNA